MLSVLPATALAEDSTSPGSGDALPGEATAVSTLTEKTLGPAVSFLPAQRYRLFLKDGAGFEEPEARQWSVLVELLRNQPVRNKLQLAQKYFSMIPYRSDIELFGVDDYWASAAQVLRTGGDCEDHALAKYRLLADAGVPPEDMRVVLAENTENGEEHAYLVVDTEEGSFVLDNRLDQIVTEKYVSSYRPLYAVNAYTVWSYTLDPVQLGAGNDDIHTAADR